MRFHPFSSDLLDVSIQNFNIHWEDKRGFPCLLSGSRQFFLAFYNTICNNVLIKGILFKKGIAC